MKDRHICHVCGFDGLKEPPYNKANEPSYEICPCCGFEFGFDSQQSKNKEEDYKSYRDEWFKNGAKWFILQAKPKDWQLYKQLENIIIRKKQ
ncbi:hypothetical protein ACFL2Y_02120 [Candidatus Omnitrophota bacterium]